MSLASLEREMLQEARTVFNNPKLKKTDIIEWSTGGVNPADADEVTGRLPRLKINVCVPAKADKRALPK